MPYNEFTNQKYLITAAELNERLSEIILIDVRPAEEYAAGHIEGTTHFDLYGISVNDTAPEPLEAFLSMFHHQFEFRGVTNETPVVIYDQETGERAARGVWLLAVLNHPDVRLLDGGVQAWTDAGLASTTATTPPTRTSYKSERNLDLLATRFDVQRAIEDDNVVLIDVRRDTEYLGTEKRARRVGTIPGSVHIPWRDHLNEKGAFRPAEEIRELYVAKGITPDKTVIAYCQGGYRSANTFLALKSLGYPNVRNYMGSWGEWGNRDDSAIVLPEKES
jgi:thiosulfate/3-mercaptopyruvate sulfurtransferase